MDLIVKDTLYCMRHVEREKKEEYKERKDSPTKKKAQKYQDLYLQQTDGIPRCLMFELITRLAMKYFTDEKDLPSTLYKFLT